MRALEGLGDDGRQHAPDRGVRHGRADVLLDDVHEHLKQRDGRGIVQQGLSLHQHHQPFGAAAWGGGKVSVAARTTH